MGIIFIGGEQKMRCPRCDRFVLSWWNFCPRCENDLKGIYRPTHISEKNLQKREKEIKAYLEKEEAEWINKKRNKKSIFYGGKNER